MLILGVDPGYRNLGYCLVNHNGKTEILNHGVVDVGSTKDWHIGLGLALTTLANVCASPDLVAVEELVWHGRRRGVLALSHLAGAIAGYYKRGCQTLFFTPKEVKIASQEYPFPDDFSDHEKDALSLCRLALWAKANDNAKLADKPKTTRRTTSKRTKRRR